MDQRRRGISPGAVRVLGRILLTELFAKHDVLRKLLVERIRAICIRHHVGNAGFGSSVDQLLVRPRICPHIHRDDKELLALQGLHDARLVVVVDLDRDNALGQRIVAIGTSDGGDGMLARLDEGFGEPPAKPPPCLEKKYVSGENPYDLLIMFTR